MTNFIKYYQAFISLRENIKKIIPYSVRRRTDAESFGITKFMEFASQQIKPFDNVLDAGAGSCPYKYLFSHAKYESTDFEDIFDKTSKEKHDFICSLDEIPKPKNSYDAIINTQVLEHVEYPQKVVNEFYRILKTNGKLFLTAPQGPRVHGEPPYHFFNFTKYGLESLFKNAGFEIVFIKPKGGIFWYLGDIIRDLPEQLMFMQFRQYLIDSNTNSTELKMILLLFIVFPLYLVSIPCLFFIPLLFFYLDRFDKIQNYTLGYACYCLKKDDAI
jgi:SAM-dependent methyltransferase